MAMFGGITPPLEAILPPQGPHITLVEASTPAQSCIDYLEIQKQATQKVLKYIAANEKSSNVHDSSTRVVQYVLTIRDYVRQQVDSLVKTSEAITGSTADNIIVQQLAGLVQIVGEQVAAEKIFRKYLANTVDKLPVMDAERYASNVSKIVQRFANGIGSALANLGVCDYYKSDPVKPIEARIAKARSSPNLVVMCGPEGHYG